MAHTNSRVHVHGPLLWLVEVGVEDGLARAVLGGWIVVGWWGRYLPELLNGLDLHLRLSMVTNKDITICSKWGLECCRTTVTYEFLGVTYEFLDTNREILGVDTLCTQLMNRHNTSKLESYFRSVL